MSFDITELNKLYQQQKLFLLSGLDSLYHLSYLHGEVN